MGTCLYEYIDSYLLHDETILSYKNHIKQILADELLGKITDFTIYNYISGKMEYPYLDDRYSNIAQLLPSLDAKSRPFLLYTVRNMLNKAPRSRFIFIHTENTEEQDYWRATYPRYFQLAPNAAETISRFKLIVIQKQDILLKDWRG